jgi:DNA-binding transcriptional ArsR family regulator
VTVGEGSDPTKWVDEWPIAGLELNHRISVKSRLMKAHALFLRTPESEFPTEIAMRLAFTDIAELLFDLKILTIGMLEKELPLFILESAIAGGWWWPYSWTVQGQTRVEIFPRHFGHLGAWEFLIKNGLRVFAAEIADWHSKLLEVEAKDDGPAEPESLASQLNRLREECNITVEELAEALDVTPRSIYRHLDDTPPRRKQIRAYEALFTKLLGRKIVMPKTSGKRQ